MAEQQKAVYTKPNSQVDLENRLANDNVSSRVLVTSDSYRELADDGKARDFSVEDNDLSNYVGTDPIYQSYAVDTDKALLPDEGVERELHDKFLKDVDPGTVVQPEAKDEEPEPFKAESTTASHTPAAPKSPEQGTEKVKAASAKPVPTSKD